MRSKTIAIAIQCQLINNTAISNGGGIYITAHTNYITAIAEVAQYKLINNEAIGNGGAI